MQSGNSWMRKYLIDGVGPSFYAGWGDKKYNVVEINTLKGLGLELLQLKVDVKKETQFFGRAEEDLVPEGMLVLDDRDEDIHEVIKQVFHKELLLKQDMPLSTIDRTTY